jgi:hypothetical protein
MIQKARTYLKKRILIQNQGGWYLSLSFGHLNFEFVSNFDIRYSDLVVP